jgi:hypothetical protein
VSIKRNLWALLLLLGACTPQTAQTRMLEPWQGPPPPVPHYYGDYLHQPKYPKAGDCWQLPVPTCDFTVSGPIEVFIPQ